MGFPGMKLGRFVRNFMLADDGAGFQCLHSILGRIAVVGKLNAGVLRPAPQLAGGARMQRPAGSLTLKKTTSLFPAPKGSLGPLCFIYSVLKSIYLFRILHYMCRVLDRLKQTQWSAGLLSLRLKSLKLCSSLSPHASKIWLRDLRSVPNIE